MRRTVSRVTLAVVGVLLASAMRAHAQLPLSIDDVRTPEGSAGMWGLSVPVRLPGPPPSNVTVTWTLVPGSATAPADFSMIPPSGSLTFSALIDSTKYINVQIVGDTVEEWSPTLKQDKVFFIELSNPVNATIAKDRGTITLLDDDRLTVNQKPGVQFLSAVSGSVSPHGATNGQVKLQWRVPAAQAPPIDVVIRENVGAACTFPPATTAGAAVANTGPPPGPGMVQTYTHSNLALNQLHCYSVFSRYGAGDTTEVATIKATPFSAAGTIAWTYASGSTSVVPPTVGTDAIYTVDNQGTVHAMLRGTAGGAWPPSWNPVAVGAPTQNRSAVVPTSGGSRLFLGTDGGGVHAVDARFGTIVWSRSANFGGTALPNVGGAAIQAQPAGLFKDFGGNNDMLLVGTNEVVPNNKFFALDPATGNTLGPIYGNSIMGGVGGMAVVDYAANRVYFSNASVGATLIALDLGPIGTPNLTFSSALVWNPKTLGTGTNGSVVLRNNRLYVGDNTSQLFVLYLDGTSYAAPTGDGAVKGFLWPDRRNDNLYFSTTNKVHAVRDTGSGFVDLWSPIAVLTPSMVLQKPGTDFIYVGNGNGGLVQINVSTQAQITLPLEGAGVQIGAPSLDGGNNLLMVGSSTGTIHAVRVPY